MIDKSDTCTSKLNGKPLSVYYSKAGGQRGADEANERYGHNLVPYHCKECDFWHLSPKDRQTPNKKCSSCKDYKGNLKNLYETEQDAIRRSQILFEEQGVKLKVYKCPHVDGWHLTSH